MTGAEIAFFAGYVAGALSCIILLLLRAVPEEEERK